MHMATSTSYGSAKIYQFPVGGRAALGDRRSADTKSPIDQRTPGVNETICSGSWYHEEAIQEERPGWQR
jgi:hypothetical protein